MPRISVIVPVYNAAAYLQQTIEVIQAQTFSDYELILVNDGSTDRSGMICEEFARQDARIKVIQKENEGAGPTRNAGLAIAGGEYVAFPDADDWVEPDLLESTYQAACAHAADLVIFGVERTVTDSNSGALLTEFQTPLRDDIFLTQHECRRQFVNLLTSNIIFDSPANKLYSMAVIRKNHVRFPALKRGQDGAFNLEFYNGVGKVVFLPKILYHYRDNDQTKIWQKFPKNHIESVVYYHRRLHELLESWGEYGAKEKLLFDERFIGSVLWTIALCRNPQWKLSPRQQCAYIREILDHPYVGQRLATATVATREMQQLLHQLRNHDIRRLLIGVYTAAFTHRLQGQLPGVYTFARALRNKLRGR